MSIHDSRFTNKSLVIIGGGAAGFFCAVNAARMYPGLKVTIAEKSSKLLGKVRISGGGRCNVTHACFSIADMIRQYPRGSKFLKSAFHHFFTTDTVAWFNERGVSLKTEADGRMFPVTNNSQTIIDCLLAEANKYKVEILMNAEVKNIVIDQSLLGNVDPGKKKFAVEFAPGKKINADFICIACGGYPKASQFEWLIKTGHHIEAPVPSLFTFNIPGNNITELMGVSVSEASVKIAGTKLQQKGPLLITHWGLSGPAVLKLSAWAAKELASKQYSFTAIVNWVVAYNESTLKQKIQQLRFEIASQKIYNRNPFALPARLWEYLLQQCSIPADMRWADLPAKEQNKLIKIVCNHELEVKGKTTFKEEFVTAGGIALSEIDVNSMQSKLAPGLFFAGEILDVDGVTGGFNFQNAWTTGWIAAKGVGAFL